MTNKQYRIFLKGIKFKTNVSEFEHNPEFDFFEKEDIKLLSEFVDMLHSYRFWVTFRDFKTLSTDKKTYFVLNSPFHPVCKIKDYDRFKEEKLNRVINIFCDKYNYEKEHPMMDGFFVNEGVTLNNVANCIILVTTEIINYLEKRYDK